MMVLYASADQIARAIVAAARLTGADPLKIYEPSPATGNPLSRARFLAFAGVLAVFPECRQTALGRLLGIPSSEKIKWNFGQARSAKWWREDWVDKVVGVILAKEIDLPAAAPAPSSEEKLRQYYRPTRKPKRCAGRALDLGEPVSGRSALDQRRAGVTPQYEDDDEPIQRGRAGCIRKPVSLPRLKFLEKDF
jgi:hypothetical protein